MNKSREQNIAEARRQAHLDKLLGPGHFCFPPKTTISIMSYREGEVFSVEQVMEYLQAWRRKDEDLVVSIQGKYDGISCFLHRDKDGKFYVYTDNGSEVSNRVPHLIDLARKEFPSHDYIVIGEVEKWIKEGPKRVHRGREYIAGEFHSKGEPQDKDYVWNLYDCIWFNGKDIHKKNYRERFEVLKSGFRTKQSLLNNLKPGFNLVPNFVCDADSKVRRVLNRLDEFEYLEGAMIKKWNGFKFELDGRTQDVLKFKKYAEGHFWVVSTKRIRGSAKTFQYQVAIEVLPSELDDVDEKLVRDFQGKKAMVVAKTFNTNIKAKIGDVLTVKFHNVYATRNKKGKLKITLYEPKAYENRSIVDPKESPDTVSTLIKIGKDSGLLRYKDDDIIPFELIKQQSIFTQYPSEEQVHRFIIHTHFRGKSAHGDLRIEHVGNKYLLGYTLDIQMPKEIEEPVFTLSRARRETHNEENWKFNVVTGRFRARRTRAGLRKATSIMVQLKKPEPKEWISFEGVVERGGPGATKEFPGVFYIAAKGTAEYGFRSPYYHEYWFHCRNWEGGGHRLIFRQLGSDFGAKSLSISTFLQDVFDVDVPVDEFIAHDDGSISCEFGDIMLPEEITYGFQDDLVLALPPSEEQEVRTPTVWMMIKPNDVRPYVLSRRAVKKGRMTPYGVSALPRQIRKQVPQSYRYWMIRDSAKAKKTRDELVNAIKKGKVEINWNVFKAANAGSIKAEGVSRTLVLNHRTWKGPFRVRMGYSGSLYDLWIDEGEYADLFMFSEDPRSTVVSGAHKRIFDKDLMNVVGEVAPSVGSKLNPNKRIPVYIERLVKGRALFYVDTDSVKEFKINVEEWEGLYSLTRDENTNVWTIEPIESVEEDL